MLTQQCSSRQSKATRDLKREYRAQSKDKRDVSHSLDINAFLVCGPTAILLPNNLYN